MLLSSPLQFPYTLQPCPAQDRDSARKRIEALGGEAVEDVSASCPPDVLLCTSVCAGEYKVCACGLPMVHDTRRPRRDALTIPRGVGPAGSAGRQGRDGRGAHYLAGCVPGHGTEGGPSRKGCLMQVLTRVAPRC